jgi:hypothetical protein
MLKFDETIAVNGAAADVYAYVADPLNIPRYQAEVLSTRLTTDGPLKVGSHFEETMKMAFATKTFDCTVLELTAQRKVRFAATGDALDCEVEFHLEPEAGGVKLRMSGFGQLKGAWRLMTPMMRMGVVQGARRQLVAIRAAVEGAKQAPAGRPSPALALLAALTLFLPAQSSHAQEAAKAAPELAKTVEAFVGQWTYDATVAVNGATPKKTKLTMGCTATAKGKALACTLKGNVPDSGPYEAGLLIGFDTFGKKVHFMAITSDEEVHDHVCAWSAPGTLACDALKGGMGGGEITEDLGFTFNGDTGGFKSMVTMKDGTKVAFEATGRRKKG